MKIATQASDLSFRAGVKRKVENEGISITFALLLLSYEEQANRIEAFYWDISINKEVRKEKMREVFGISRNEANRLSKLYEANK